MHVCVRVLVGFWSCDLIFFSTERTQILFHLTIFFFLLVASYSHKLSSIIIKNRLFFLALLWCFDSFFFSSSFHYAAEEVHNSATCWLFNLTLNVTWEILRAFYLRRTAAIQSSGGTRVRNVKKMSSVYPPRLPKKERHQREERISLFFVGCCWPNITAIEWH